MRSDDMLSDNLHNHPINPPSKIPVKVEADIRKAIQANPHLKTSEIMIGYYPYHFRILMHATILLPAKCDPISLQSSATV